MCCDLQKHVIIISIISLISTGIGFIAEFTFLRLLPELLLRHSTFTDIQGYCTLAFEILICIALLFSEVLCLVGAIKNNARLLLPFIILLCLTTIGFVVCGIVLLYYLFVAWSIVEHGNRDGGIALLVLSIALCIILAINIYFMVILVKFYKKLTSGYGSLP